MTVKNWCIGPTEERFKTRCCLRDGHGKLYCVSLLRMSFASTYLELQPRFRSTILSGPHPFKILLVDIATLVTL